MSKAIREREDVNTDFTARTWTPFFGPSDYDRVDRFIADGKTDEEIEDLTGIFEESIAEYRNSGQKSVESPTDATNRQIMSDLPKKLADQIKPPKPPEDDIEKQDAELPPAKPAAKKAA